ncbi:DNA/RNA non-specific endonuclease [Reyranella sp.]|uniref:DNA/RNA non-specific endonuclease n=1 Tax=Reyranella sp. TaxID=1929291 RepID=UPI003D11D845
MGINLVNARSAATDLPFGVERRMGASLDWVGLAPSEQARKAGRPVARIVSSTAPNIEPEGFATGFLVSTDLLMTNWHVFPTRTDAVGCGANFLHELTERGLARGLTFALEPERFFLSDRSLDFAVIAVAPLTDRGEALSDLGQITLIEARPKILKGQPVNIIQHPEGQPKRYAVAQNRLVDILEAEGFLQYETDTLEGSSGAPAFSEHWELVALHHASIPAMRDGKPLTRNGELWTRDMGDDAVHWIANEGTRISAIVAKLATMSAPSSSEAAILRALIALTADPVPEAIAAVTGAMGKEAISIKTAAPLAAAATTLQETRMGAIQFTFTGPVTINISAPVTAGAMTTAPVAGAERPVAVERSIRFDPDYDGREGYDPGFLDDDGTIVVPTPTIAPERLAEIYKGEDGRPLVLKYHHFELVMNRVRRLQMWSAVNVDYSPERKVEGEREDWGSDRWIPDPRIPAAVQIFDADFYKPAGNIDRGHIVRREDNEWGDNDLEIEFANSDTFHWTNCTPQHEAFNQANPARNDRTYRGREGVWGAFENHIQRSRKEQDSRACILAGPILDKEDPSADFGRGVIKYPIRFFKVVCVADELQGGKELKVFAFILSQQNVVDEFGIERFGPGKFKRHQVPLTDIEREAGIVFDPMLHSADLMAGQPATALASLDAIRGL